MTEIHQAVASAGTTTLVHCLVQPAQLEVADGSLAEALLVPPGTRALLTTGMGRSAVEPRRLTTADAREFRAWLNLPDDQPVDLWLDGGGNLVAALYAVRDVTIAEDATLVVAGAPALLLFRRLTIHEGGRLRVYTACHGRFGVLEKRGGAWA